MSNIAVIYWSGTGNTEAMAEAVAGASGGELFSVDAWTPEKSNDFQAFALGCPSMGSEELEDTEFLPVYETLKASLAGKKVALFGSYDWGDGEWMRTWQDEVKDLGAILVADGLICQQTPGEEELAACTRLGKQLAAD